MQKRSGLMPQNCTLYSSGSGTTLGKLVPISYIHMHQPAHHRVCTETGAMITVGPVEPPSTCTPLCDHWSRTADVMPRCYVGRSTSYKHEAYLHHKTSFKPFQKVNCIIYSKYQCIITCHRKAIRLSYCSSFRSSYCW